MAERRQTELESQVTDLQQRLRQAQLERTSLEESFGRERTELASRCQQVWDVESVGLWVEL